ncbi:DNA-binding CsgD family transcriptional regulator [Paenarthrobacter ilicis]|uniref:DNA-binding CsgD family transcriptional regulator n=1 Tax=Paenarthrobacter ilicis TaxID=43665 RepID=A0ABX0TQE1_9MICC|nr:AAA family ATPase [Paenarthrobacter ilicis]NIJ03430.1 DNA-binding CsgD family transcriptional regulator [Paenarthrobacter ilicis]
MRQIEVDRVLGFISKGLSVRIIGASGSGRTSVAKCVAERLEADGVALYSMFATPSLASVPFAGVIGLGLDIRSRMVSVLGMADLFAAQLARSESNVIIIDDAENLDKESLAVVNIVRDRSEVSLVITTSDRPLRTTPSSGLLGNNTEATVQLLPLGFVQVRYLIFSLLGAPADVDVVARVLTGSGGNVRLAVRIVRTAILSERLVLRDGVWSMNGNDLMNEHLHSAVESLFMGLGADEVRALRKISSTGPTPMDQLRATLGETILDHLESEGLISVVAGPEGTPFAAVFPPIVDDYFRSLKKTRGRPGALPGGVDAGDEAGPAAHMSTKTRTHLLNSAVTTIGAEMGGRPAASTRYFQQRLQAMEQSHYETWKGEPNPKNALALLDIYWGAHADDQRIQEILRSTNTSEGSREEILLLTLTAAWWKYSAEHDRDGAIKDLHDFSLVEPDVSAEASIFSEFLQLKREETPGPKKAPTDLHDKSPLEMGPAELTGTYVIIKGLIDLYNFNPEQALKITQSDQIDPHLRKFKEFIHSMGVFLSGETETALGLALEYRQKALDEVDQFAFVSQSYTAVLALLHHGLFDEAEYLMSRTFSLGRHGLFAGVVRTAMFGLSSLKEIGSADSWATGPGIRDISPFPGTDVGLQNLVASRPVSAKAFDLQASQLIERSTKQGFASKAMHTAMFALSLLPGPLVTGVLRKILDDRSIRTHNQLLDIADAAINGNLQRLQHLLDGYVPDGDSYQICMVLRGAGKRWQLSGETSTAQEVRKAGDEFLERFRPIGTLINFKTEFPGSTLTIRETEVAMLVGHQSNYYIAKHFGISIRTVESHISNALRKTDTTTRNQLADLVVNSQEAALIHAMTIPQGDETTGLTTIQNLKADFQ